MILKERTSSGSGIPVFEYMIIFALNYGNNFTEIVEFFERMQKSCELSKTSNSWQYQLCKSMYARALLFSGEALQAKKVYRIEDLTPVPINYKYYVTIRFYLIRIDFLLLEERFAEVKGIIE